MRLRLATLLVATLIGAGCTATTVALWDETHPGARIWVDASEVTEAALQERGVDYIPYDGELGAGYLVKKSALRQLGDHSVRALATPITLAIDATTTVVIVGAAVVVMLPDLALGALETAVNN